MNTKSIHKMLAAMAAFSTLLIGCTFQVNTNTNTVVGSGKTATETRPVSGVNGVTLATSGKLIVMIGDSESLSVSADDNLLPLLTSDVNNGRLTLGTKPMSSFSTRSPIIYQLTVKSFDMLDSNGSGDAIVTGVKGERWTTNINGSGNVTADGKVKRQDITVNGSGSYIGENLDSEMASAKIAGSGSIAVKVSDNLNANISGSGSITYAGDPKTVDKRVSGSGTINKR